jgi:tetratricopeptide (TPR) repeat protein
MNLNAAFPRCARILVALIASLTMLASAGRADTLKDARNALQADRLDEALRLFEKSASDGSAEGRAGVGQVWLKRRQYGKAMDAFVTAQKMDPILALPYYGQGEVLRAQGKATDLDRKFPEAVLALGACQVELHKVADGVQTLSQGLKWGSKWRPRFLVALGEAEEARDSLRAAGIYYTQAREEAPQDAVPRKALGLFYLHRGTFESAVLEYQAAVDLDSADVELHYGLGQALFYAERYNEALEQYKSVVARDPEFAPGEFALGDLFYRSGAADRKRYAEARPPLEQYVTLKPDDPKGWDVLGRTYYQLGLRDSALTLLNKADKMGAKSKELYLIRARLQVERKAFDEALADYAKADPGPEDMLRIAQVHVFQGHPARAESLYMGILDRDSTSGQAKFALNELGKLKYKAQAYDAAAPLFQRRIALDPNSDEAYYYLGLSLKQLKRNPEAIDALRHATELVDVRLQNAQTTRATAADRHFWLGMVYADADSTPRSRVELNRAVELDTTGTTRNTGFALRQLGYYDLLDKGYTEAVRKLEKSTSINDQDLQAWIWLAQGYQNLGNRSKACDAYDHALAIDPNQAVALKGKKAAGCGQGG